MGDSRLKLTNEQEKLFLETCIEETLRVGYRGTSLHMESWAVLGKKLDEVYGIKSNQKQLKNKFDYIRGKYLAWAYLKRKTGNIYNSQTNMFNLTSQEWDDVCKVHPKASYLKTAPLANHELCATLYDKNSATGSIRCPVASRKASTSSQNSSIPNLLIDDGIIESQDDENTYNQGTHETSYETGFEADSSIPEHTSVPNLDRCRAKKKAKHTIDLTELEVDMRKAIANLAENKHKGPTIDDCHEKLKGLGLETTDPIFLAAFGIFSQPSNNYREAWMTLPSHPDVLKNWITMMAKTLGIMNTYIKNYLLSYYELVGSNKLKMDNAQKLAFVIFVYFYFKYFRPRHMKRNRDNTSKMSGHEFTTELLEGNNIQCIDLLRMSRDSFVRLCAHFKIKGWLKDSKHISVEEKMATFLMVIGHNQSLVWMKRRFQHSKETIHKYFHEVLDKMMIFAEEVIRPTSFNHNPNIPENNRRERRIFKGAVGALDGTLIHAIVPRDQQHLYRARGRGECYQNVLAICDFNMIFTFIVAGWEGTAHDARILNEALIDPDFEFPLPPTDKYYLCDVAYKHTRGFMTPYRNVRYWLGDFRRRRALNSKEKFNHAHAKLRNVIERAFGVLKARFPILTKMPPYPLVKQRDITIACFAIHNYIRKEDLSDELFSEYDQDGGDDGDEEDDDNDDDEDELPSYGSSADQQYMINLRDEIATQLMRN